MKATVEIDDDAFDVIMVKKLEDHIVQIHTDSPWHIDDLRDNEKLKEALWVVFDYFAGEAKAEELKNSIEGGKDEV